ncbi:hypothetical protein AXW87_15240 [Pseudomonas aeruginosa]|uniref:hypothetical protein n=1 Tax=Pseudomonas aeruginosa TaxID=287 RepID=UPI000E68E696|nr:hypothetical protein [Pseudomonas aeruginosa]MCT5585405.1 hypothetical protein [Pseudomonas aeruginosa]RIY52151.1 hypothetical protein AXW87_15190 [Pseudomonas aeruginosa]RIY52161.1 hypothetical protein AXW87_15240 [Pseudomonas aeruginosa]RIY58086.1 hypothetical protein AXW88_14970 [Pseudomonas aeruginosa]RIY58096.1 hypothetical protein AXW88_15020 [Pseudomonas aeruginosa]
MIDPADKQTQALPLEQPKRGRGRPATGKALSDAERARRYRANKKKRDDQPSRKDAPSIPADGVKEILDGWQRTQDELDQALQRITELEAELASRVEKHNDLVHKLMTERDQLKRDLAAKPKRHRDQPAAELPESAYEDESEAKTWTLQGRSGSGKWQNLAAGLDREEASRQLDRVIDNKLLGATKGRQYRLVEE